MPKTAVFTPPKNLAVCADQLYNTRNHRLSLQKEVDALAAQETTLREHLINNLPKSQATGVAGKLVRVSIETKTVGTVQDWDALRAYIVKQQKKDPGVWGLLNKAVNQATLKDMWEHGATVPGVTALQVPFVSMNKL